MYFYFAWTFVLLKRLLAYLYLWQKKEYRLDKIIDYLNTPESKGFLWDRFTRVYFGCFTLFIALYISFTYKLVDKNFVLVLAITTIIAVNIVYWVDTIISITKLIRGNLLMPKFSSKMISIFFVSLLLLYTLASFVMSFQFAIGAIFGLAVIFTIPIMILISSLLIKPIEIFKKKQIIDQAKSKREQMPNLKVIAVSGSYGKTTTKDILYELLSSKFKVIKSQKNQNTNLSLARQVIGLDPETEIMIAEIGAYKKGDGNDTCVFLNPTVSIITGLNNQHLSLFGSEQSIVEAESESIAFLPDGAKVYINMDSTLCKKIIVPKGIESIKYGIKNDLDVSGSDITTKDFQTTFTINRMNKRTKLTTNLVSNGNIENLVGALAVALDLGVDMDSIHDIITTIPATPGALEVIQKPWGNLINDSYNANINGVINAISLLKEMKGKKILVLDDILELGEQAIDTHKVLAYSISKLNIDLVILMGRNYTQVITEILVQEDYKGEYYIYDKQRSQIDEIMDKGFENSTNVLLEGYRSRLLLGKM
jgi:UDP-N-acetylmuramoyl-tripeptide--D-alanyl-D-alanine ligase